MMRVRLHDHQLGEEEEELHLFKNAIIIVTTTAHHVVFLLPLIGGSLRNHRDFKRFYPAPTHLKKHLTTSPPPI
jgi:hypothetical protein